MNCVKESVAISLITVASGAEQSIPRPEHPQPQAVRQEWLNLNGVWEFGESNAEEDELFLGQGGYPEEILVPFCRESKLSGIERRPFVKNVWYRRTFQVPKDWTSPRFRFHVGACDWRTRVWMNGEFIGEHTGGNVSFAFDASDHVLRDQENTVIIHAFDDTPSHLQALGKQSDKADSYGIFYTPTTGIWQTVWLEGVGESFVSSFRVATQVRQERAVLNIAVDGPLKGLAIKAVARAEGEVVAEAMAPARWRDNVLELKLPEPRLWSPKHPHLYDLELYLMRGEVVVDKLNSYFGMREVTIDGAAVQINGEAIFQRLILDQGFFPEGVWTAPTEEALKKDIELSMACGFNGARMHQKVFEPRFHYWADKLGYLVWGEFPSYNADYGNHAVDLPILNEWVEIVTRDRNHPSIIGWCPFNETPAEAAHIQQVVVNMTRELDPSRPVLETSGWIHTLQHPEVMDVHDYDQNPQTFRQRWTHGWGEGITLPARYGVGGRPGMPFFISEYGGIGWALDPNAWGYGRTPKTKEEFYARFEGLAAALLDSRLIFGLCYTQLTDIEQEQNGLYTYDREPKFDVERLRAAIARPAAYEMDPPVSGEHRPHVEWDVLVGSIMDGSEAKPWQYTTEAPPAEWTHDTFDDSTWLQGMAPFGEKGGEWQSKIRTPWKTDSIWMRQEFQMDQVDFDHAAIVLHHDDDTEIYVNGKEVWRRDRWNDRYEPFEATEALKKALRPGKNVVAVRTHQIQGGQYIDLALLAGKEE